MRRRFAHTETPRRNVRRKIFYPAGNITLGGRFKAWKTNQLPRRNGILNQRPDIEFAWKRSVKEDRAGILPEGLFFQKLPRLKRCRRPLIGSQPPDPVQHGSPQCRFGFAHGSKFRGERCCWLLAIDDEDRRTIGPWTIGLRERPAIGYPSRVVGYRLLAIKLAGSLKLRPTVTGSL